LTPPYTQNQQSFGPYKERPRYFHIIVGVVVVAFFGCLLLHSTRTFLAEIIVQALSLARIPSSLDSTLEGPTLVMRLLDETDLCIVMTWQRSGLLSLMIFSSLFVLLTFPLKGPLWCKIVYLALGNVVGLAWNFVRSLLMVIATYYLGSGAFKVVDFFTGPVIDFIWIVPVWSLGLSLLAYTKR